MWWLLRVAAILLCNAAFVAALHAVCTGKSHAWLKNAHVLLIIAGRLARSGETVLLMAADYMLTRWRFSKAGDWPERLSACHERGSQRILHLAFANAGVYIKFTQHAAQMDSLLPSEYTTLLQRYALDACPQSSFEDVKRTVEGQLEAPLDTMYREFARKPIASASLAQVHRAVLHSGAEVAVKVQHRRLKDTAFADLSVIRTLVQIVRMIWPAHDFMWIVEEGERYLPEELNFVHEAANMARCRAHLDSPRSRCGHHVLIPHVFHDFTSDRVLTMEFVRGLPVADPHELQRRGIAPQDVARLVAQVFTEMVFVFGDVHCDPHAANMMVKPGEDNKPILVLLDHGLYRQIDDSFRREYAEFWHALVFQDVSKVRRHARNMNAGDLTDLFVAMITKKPWEHAQPSQQVPAPGEDSDEDDAARRRATHQRILNQVSMLLRTVPRDLLLLLRTDDCLRSLEYRLGVPLNTVATTARACTRARWARPPERRLRLRGRVAAALDRAQVELRIRLMGVFARRQQKQDALKDE